MPYLLWLCYCILAESIWQILWICSYVVLPPGSLVLLPAFCPICPPTEKEEETSHLVLKVVGIARTW